jgi:hypothetical protein
MTGSNIEQLILFSTAWSSFFARSGGEEIKKIPPEESEYLLLDYDVNIFKNCSRKLQGTSPYLRKGTQFVRDCSFVGVGANDK